MNSNIFTFWLHMLRSKSEVHTLKLPCETPAVVWTCSAIFDMVLVVVALYLPSVKCNEYNCTILPEVLLHTL